MLRVLRVLAEAVKEAAKLKFPNTPSGLAFVDFFAQRGGKTALCKKSRLSGANLRFDVVCKV
jgi:hypothetical protein